MSDEKLIWIRTQDGSPTLWNNDVGESYRSAKGAFSESLTVFIKPSLDYALCHKKDFYNVGEFGLGAGTNWLFWSLAAKAKKIPFQYFTIEKDPSAFQKALLEWKKEWPLILQVFEKHTQLLNDLPTNLQLDDLLMPTIYPTLEKALQEKKLFDIWFHDPFGFSVNPDGYSPETLLHCSQLWANDFFGTSYACNGQFQRNLKACGVKRVETCSTIEASLKKESLQFGNF